MTRGGFVEPLLLHAKTHTGLYRVLLHGSGGAIAEREFQLVVEEMLSGRLGARTGLTVTLVSGALIGCVRGWVDGRLVAPAGDVAAALRRMAKAIQTTT